MVTLYKSEITGKIYDSIDELKSDERKVAEKEAAEEKLLREKKQREEEINNAEKEYREALDKLFNLKEKYNRDYKSHSTVIHENLFDFLFS